jgi:UDP-N-acetylmuramoylalanine--D-glutamate ligase
MGVAAGERVGFTLSEPEGDDFGLIEHDDERWLAQGSELLIKASELRIKGRHNLANALAALALGSAVDLSRQAMLQVLRNYGGLPHRTQWVADKQGLEWYNDSKGTNVGATIAALQGFNTNDEHLTVLIVGGECKDADFSDLALVVEETTRGVILIGRDASTIEQALQGHALLAHADSLQDAVRKAAEMGQPGDRVLLSPACASFDMFSGFEQRGEAFIEAVEALTE